MLPSHSQSSWRFGSWVWASTEWPGTRVVYRVTVGILARLDELDASKTATKHMPCLANSNFELGRGSNFSDWRPQLVPSLKSIRVIQVACGGYHSSPLTVYERRVMQDGSYYMTYSSTASSSLVGSPVLGKRQIEEEFENFRSSRRRACAPKSEIDTYFEEEYVADSNSFDILVWWKTHAEKYPVLSTMARDFLAIPLSTVSSESAFSLGGRILGEARSSLTPEMLEALVCGKDWLFLEKDVGMDNQVELAEPAGP